MDTNQAAKAIAFTPTPWIEVKPINSAAAPATINLPSTRPSNRGRELSERRRREALAEMKSQREDILVQLENAYSAELTAQAKAFEADLAAELGGKIRERADIAAEGISSIIQSTAQIRGRLAARLTLLAGWPDKGGYKFVPIARTSAVEPAWKAETEQVRKELVELDTEINKKIQAAVDAFHTVSANEKSTIAQRIKTAYSDASREAAVRARNRISTTGRERLPTLLSASANLLHGQPAASVTLPGTQIAVPPMTRVAAVPAPVVALRTRLDIWLRIRGYKLAAGPRGVQDKTEEFINWMNHS